MVSIPTRRVIRCQEKLKKWSLRLSGKAKVLKSKLKDGSSVQIRIWIHFRIELGSKYISSGRNSWSIDFFEFENPNKGCKKFSEKMTKLKFLKILIFSIFSPKKSIKINKKALFQKIFCAAARPARPHECSASKKLIVFFAIKSWIAPASWAGPRGQEGCTDSFPVHCHIFSEITCLKPQSLPVVGGRFCQDGLRGGIDFFEVRQEVASDSRWGALYK